MFRRIALGLIRFYQLAMSPLMPPSCRFEPSCSAYAHEAISVHGFARGAWLFLKRFSRCHPWGGEGYDPVPLPTTPAAPESTPTSFSPTASPAPVVGAAAGEDTPTR